MAKPTKKPRFTKQDVIDWMRDLQVAALENPDLPLIKVATDVLKMKTWCLVTIFNNGLLGGTLQPDKDQLDGVCIFWKGEEAAYGLGERIVDFERNKELQEWVVNFFLNNPETYEAIDEIEAKSKKVS